MSAPLPREQLDIIKQMITLQHMKEGENAYLISTEWLKSWKRYVGYGSSASGDHPGQIINTHLLFQGNILHKSVKEHLHFEVLTFPIWSLLHKWYGGGPEISVEVVTHPFKGHLIPLITLTNFIIYYQEEYKKVSISIFKKVKELKVLSCNEYGVDPDNFVLRDYWNLKVGKYLNENITIIENVLSADQELILERINEQRINEKTISAVPEAITSLTYQNRNKITITKLINNQSVTKSLSHHIEFQTSTSYSNANGVCGLQNIGNSCFFNASLQCLFHTQPLIEYFNDDKWRIKVKHSNTYGNIVSSFVLLMKEYWSGNLNVIAPRELRNVINRYAPQFASYQQQDAQEMLCFILESIHNDLNQTSEQFIEKNDQITQENVWENFLLLNNSIIINLFYGMFKSQIHCPNCKNHKTKFEPFMCLSLSVPSDDIKSSPYFLFIPYDPQKPKRQMRMKILLNEKSEEKILQRLREETQIPNLYVVYAEISNTKQTIKWLNKPKQVQFDYTLNVFQIPDPNKFYSIVFLNGPKKKYIDGPFLIEIKRDMNKKEIQRICMKHFDYLWDNKYKTKLYTNTKEINQMKIFFDKFNHKKKKKTQKIIISISSLYRSLSKHSSLLKQDQSIIAKRHIKAKINPFYTSDINWNCLFRETKELSIHGSGSGSITLDELIEKCFRTTKLDTANLWECPHCNEYVQAEKNLCICKMPKILMIHLKRFQQTLQGIHRKIETNVIYPLELKMGKYLCDGNGVANYKLFGVIEHIGCMNNGHYIAKNCINGNWFLFNDSSARRCNEANVHSPKAYILMYQLV